MRKELDRYDNDKNYESPEIAWSIIGGAVFVSVLIHVFFWGFICGQGM